MNTEVCKIHVHVSAITAVPGSSIADFGQIDADEYKRLINSYAWKCYCSNSGSSFTDFELINTESYNRLINPQEE